METKEKKKKPKNKPKNKPLKRFNGQGTVYKLSGRRRKPWVASVTTGWELVDDKPKRLYQILGYFEEKNEAETALLMHSISPVSPKANMSLLDLYTEWSTTKYQYITKSTVQGYQAAWKRYDTIKNVAIKEIRTAHLQNIIDKEFQSNSSRSTLEKIKALAYSLYEYAIQNDILNKNYAEYIILPKEEKDEKEIFTDIEIQTIENNVDKVLFADTVLILIYTGLRIAELLSLTKFNVDLEAHVIRGGVKTEAGKNRVIPIHDKIYPLIVDRYNTNSEYLVPNAKGGKMSHSSFRDDKYYPALREIKVREISPHGCRHTCATLLAKAGVDTVSIQKILGHAKYATTADTYTHLDIEHLKKVMASM